jgi:hypothetical protein
MQYSDVTACCWIVRRDICGRYSPVQAGSWFFMFRHVEIVSSKMPFVEACLLAEKLNQVAQVHGA